MPRHFSEAAGPAWQHPGQQPTCFGGESWFWLWCHITAAATAPSQRLQPSQLLWKGLRGTDDPPNIDLAMFFTQVCVRGVGSESVARRVLFFSGRALSPLAVVCCSPKRGSFTKNPNSLFITLMFFLRSRVFNVKYFSPLLVQLLLLFPPFARAAKGEKNHTLYVLKLFTSAASGRKAAFLGPCMHLGSSS